MSNIRSFCAMVSREARVLQFGIRTAYFRLSQAMVDDVEETMGGHRVAQLHSELSAAFRSAYL